MKIHVLSLGCARTLVDSECLAGILSQAGHTLSEEIKEAECVVVNTCAFIREAEEESVATILELADLKKTGQLKRLYVVGCLPQKRRKERDDLLKELPEVDGFLGPGDLPRLPELIREQMGSSPWAVRPEQAVPPSTELRVNGASKDGAVTTFNRFFVASPVPTLLFDSATPRHRLTPGHFAYLKISEGCDHACSFCSIPQFRGPHRSRSIEDLVREAEELAAKGVVELNLVGQDTSYYGADRYGALRIAQLLEKLSNVSGIRWIRLLYAHPAHVDEALIQAIRDYAPIVKYLDIPLQHINDRLLKAMRRETDGTQIRRLIDCLREAVPGIAIRSTFIVGFPGETESDVEELAQFFTQAQFERVGIFPYSTEPKTPAERMPDQIPEKVKQERFNRLMELQKGISEEINRQWLGRRIEVLIDEPAEKSPQRYTLNAIRYLNLGRSYADAPEVDGQVFLKSPVPLRPGEFVQAKVIDTYEYDLVAEAILKGSDPSGSDPIRFE